MELSGNRQMPMTDIGRQSLIIRQRSLFTASSGTRCKLREPRSFTSTRSEILKTTGFRAAKAWRTSPCVHSSTLGPDLFSHNVNYSSHLGILLRSLYEKYLRLFIR